MVSKIVQAGEPVLRTRARDLTAKEIRSRFIQDLIERMRETMRDAPGVGLAAPQIGEPLQLAVVEDRSEYMRNVQSERLDQQERRPVPFHVIINPKITFREATPTPMFFEGCLSLTGFVALVPRAFEVQVDALDEHAQPIRIDARGWHARILQHEIDHLQGTLYIDRAYTRTLMGQENYAEHWGEKSIEEVWKELDPSRTP
jgi:peptide deformylase